MEFSATLGGNCFSFKSDEPSTGAQPPLVDLFRTWLNAQQPGDEAVKLEELADRLNESHKALREAIIPMDLGKENENAEPAETGN